MTFDVFATVRRAVSPPGAMRALSLRAPEGRELEGRMRKETDTTASRSERSARSRTGCCRRGPGALLAAVVIGLVAAGGAPALAESPKDPRARHMIRFEFDNDTFLGSDDVFTAAWSLQLHSPAYDTWDEAAPSFFGAVPGLGDDGKGGRVVRWAAGVSQMIVSPSDLSIAEPQPHDSPWAGILGVYASLSSYDNRRLTAAQLYLGCMGPCSQAEDVQRFVHEDLGRGVPPKGWDNQLDTKILGNLNVAGAYKLWATPESSYVPGRWASDLAIGGQIGLGNLATFARAQVEFRFGPSLPMGFTHVPDAPGLGIALDPLYPGSAPSQIRSWKAYASVVVRSTYFAYLAPAEGGKTENGGFHPGVGINHGQPELLIGLHIGRAPVALHVTYYRYLLGPEQIGLGNSLDWANISFEVRF